MRKLSYIFVFLLTATTASAQDLTILHLNDTHSHIEAERGGRYKGMGGVIEQAACIDSVRCADGKGNVLLLHAGDFSQGTSYFTEMNGDLEVDVMNAMRFDAVCLGNHEFDNGFDELARRIRNLDAPVLCANYDFKDTPLKDVVKPYAIVHKSGRKIGIIGLLTDMSQVAGKGITSEILYLHPAGTAEKYAGLLKKEGCELIIALTHLGYEGDFYTDVELAGATRNIDIIVGGHSHTFLDEMKKVKNQDGKDVVIVTAGKWGLGIGQLIVR